MSIEYRSLYYPANSARDLNIPLFAINLLWKPQLPPISQPDKLMCCHFISAFCFFKCSQSFCWCQSASMLGKFKFWLFQWLGRARHADVVELSFSGGAATIRSHYPAVAPSRLQSPSKLPITACSVITTAARPDQSLAVAMQSYRQSIFSSSIKPGLHWVSPA